MSTLKTTQKLTKPQLRRKIRTLIESMEAMEDPMQRGVGPGDAREEAQFTALVKRFLDCAYQLDEFWSQSQLDPDWSSTGYPFASSFEEVVSDIQDWYEQLLR
jgi:hypothetical protein